MELESTEMGPLSHLLMGKFPQQDQIPLKRNPYIISTLEVAFIQLEGLDATLGACTVRTGVFRELSQKIIL